MLTDRIKEVIFVGLPGPTHNYGGLSFDNKASSQHRGQASFPHEAALQVLSLVRLLMGFGIEVGVLPPQLRPNLDVLQTKFSGDAASLIAQAAQQDPLLLEAASSSASMWAANAATVAPGIDCQDGSLHITVANLHTNLHRRIEARDMLKTLRSIFAAVPNAKVHERLSAVDAFRDEGAANHMRLTPRHDKPGLNVFVYGTDGKPGDPVSARQNLVASEEVAAQHTIPHSALLFLKQNPEAITKGVFHNDVIAVSNESVLLVHEKAYAGGYGDIERIENAYQALNPGRTPVVIVIKEEALSLEEAVATYFFNSQIVTTDSGMAIIAPREVETLFGGKAKKLLENIIIDSQNPIEELHIINLRQSMNNGGGPACLRLRVPMTEAQLGAIAQSVNVMASEALLEKIEAVIRAHYPAELQPADLADPALYRRSLKVQQELAALMKL